MPLGGCKITYKRNGQSLVSCMRRVWNFSTWFVQRIRYAITHGPGFEGTHKNHITSVSGNFSIHISEWPVFTPKFLYYSAKIPDDFGKTSHVILGMYFACLKWNNSGRWTFMMIFRKCFRNIWRRKQGQSSTSNFVGDRLLLSPLSLRSCYNWVYRMLVTLEWLYIWLCPCL